MDLCLRKGSKAPKEFEFILFVAENHWRKKEMGLKAMQYSDLKMVVLTCVEDEKRLKKKRWAERRERATYEFISIMHKIDSAFL